MDGTNSASMNAKRELRRIAAGARERLVELVELRFHVQRPFRKQIDITKIVDAIDETCEDVVIHAAAEARPFVQQIEHLLQKESKQ